MRLIDTEVMVTDQIISFHEFYSNRTPDYAILSHTWEEGQEVVFHERNSPSAKDKKGFGKIMKTCELAVAEGIQYAWVDACCIDKSSSAELTEAINSMFKWYERAKVCYVWLSDLVGHASADLCSLSSCRWFHRGWTLQELVAPRDISFFNQSWQYIGSKDILRERLHNITTIDMDVLENPALRLSVPVGRRLSWAANRETTREEDIAYSLLGIFDINMPMLYGEGTKAFTRLQEEIMRSTYDLTILAWTRRSNLHSSPYCGFLAQSPKDFENSATIRMDDTLREEGEMAITNKGIQLRARLSFRRRGHTAQYLLPVGYRSPDYSSNHTSTITLAIPIRKIGPDTFIRAHAYDKLRPVFDVLTGTIVTLSSGPTRLPSGYLRHVLLTGMPDWLPPQLPDGEEGSLMATRRHAAVRIQFGPDFDPLRQLKAPMKYWDEQEGLFFTTTSPGRGWGALNLRHRFMSVAMIVCVWHIGLGDQVCPFSWFMFPAEEFDPVLREIFLLAEKLDWGVESVLSALNPDEKEKSDSIRVSTRSGLAEITPHVQEDKDLSICSGPLWNIKIKMRLVDNAEGVVGV